MSFAFSLNYPVVMYLVSNLSLENKTSGSVNLPLSLLVKPNKKHLQVFSSFDTLYKKLFCLERAQAKRAIYISGF